MTTPNVLLTTVVETTYSEGPHFDNGRTLCVSRSSAAAPAASTSPPSPSSSDPEHEITVWERNAADDTFGFGVVFSDETLGGIEHADPAVYRQMEAEFARWDDIDVHFKGEVVTSGGHGFAAMSRKRLLQILQERCRELGVTVHFRTEAPDVDELAATHDLVIAADGLNSAVRARHADELPAHARAAGLQVHVARHRQGVRRVQVLHLRDAVRRDADPRLPVRRARQHVHRRDERHRLARRGLRRLRRGRRSRPASRTRSRSPWCRSSSPTCSTATR